MSSLDYKITQFLSNNLWLCKLFAVLWLGFMFFVEIALLDGNESCKNANVCMLSFKFLECPSVHSISVTKISQECIKLSFSTFLRLKKLYFNLDAILFKRKSVPLWQNLYQ